jgi:hypothetical protein
MQTPWGKSIQSNELAPGIIWYFTDRHGGIWLSPTRIMVLLDTLDPALLDSWPWYEEDCDWAIPFVFFRDEIQEYNQILYFREKLSLAWEILSYFHPGLYQDLKEPGIEHELAGMPNITSIENVQEWIAEPAQTKDE